MELEYGNVRDNNEAMGRIDDMMRRGHFADAVGCASAMHRQMIETGEVKSNKWLADRLERLLDFGVAGMCK